MTKLIPTVILHTLICSVAVSCSTKNVVDSEASTLLNDNRPDTKEEFEAFKEKCMNIKVGTLRNVIRHSNFNDDLVAKEVDSKFRYTYLIWIYTGYYDSETVIHPYYVYPQTAKGKVMHNGLQKGLDLHSKTTENKPIESNQ
jgi:hypothetical protein